MIYLKWRKRFFSLLTLFLFILLASVTSFPGVSFSETGKPFFAINAVGKQGYFLLTAQPGTTQSVQARIANVGTGQGTANVYAVDSFTSDTSGATYCSANDPKRDVGAWTQVSVKSVQLAPGKNQIVTLMIRIPPHVRQGQHLGGLVVEDTTPQAPATTQTTDSKKAGISITIKHKTILAILITVPGPQATYQNLNATGVTAGGQAGYQTLLLSLQNPGNTLLKPYGTFHVADSANATRVTSALQLVTFVPQTAIAYPLGVQGRSLEPGNYTASLLLHYGDGHTLTKTFAFTITTEQVQKAQSYTPTTFQNSSSGPPILLILAGIAFVLFMGIALLFFMHRSRKRRDGPPITPLPNVGPYNQQSYPSVWQFTPGPPQGSVTVQQFRQPPMFVGEEEEARTTERIPIYPPLTN